MNNLNISAFSRAMHWIIAILFLFVFCIPLFLKDMGVPFPYHKMLGSLVLILSLVRVINRFVEGWPKDISTRPNQLLIIISKIVHWILLLSTIIFPLSGLLMGYYGGRGLELVGFEIIGPEPMGSNGRPTPIDGQLAGTFHTVHTTMFWVFSVSFILHVLGAYYHHLILKDATLIRMLRGYKGVENRR